MANINELKEQLDRIEELLIEQKEENERIKEEILRKLNDVEYRINSEIRYYCD